MSVDISSLCISWYCVVESGPGLLSGLWFMTRFGACMSKGLNLSLGCLHMHSRGLNQVVAGYLRWLSRVAYLAPMYVWLPGRGLVELG